jgi:YD repeat-containing protein
MQYNGWLGLTNVTGPNAASASFSYDGYSRPAQTTSPHGAITTFAYTTNTTTATTNGHWVKTTVDGFGRTIKVETGDGTSTKSVVDTEYDSCACSPIGKVKRVSQPYAPGAGTLYWTTYNYDADGRTVSTVLPDNSGTSTYAYQGNVTTVTDPAGKWKKYTTDAFGNLTQVEEPNSGSAPVAIAVYNTGVNTSGGLLADGATDSHYTLAVSPDPAYPGPAAKVVNSNGWPIPPWLANGPTSKWIAPRPDQVNGNALGYYTYRITFNLTGYDAATAQLTGQWAADDAGTMKLNGANVSTSNGFTAFTAFTITSGFTPGLNTLDFVVINGGSSANPSAVRVEISGTVSPAAGPNYITTYTYNLHNQLTGVSMPRPTATQTRTFNYDLATKRLRPPPIPRTGRSATPTTATAPSPPGSTRKARKSLTRTTPSSA